MVEDILNEADTRLRLIDPVIKKAGWSNSDIKLEYPVKIEDSNQYIDYLLLDDDGRYLAVVEAKRVSVSVEAGVNQAMRYGKSLDVYFRISTNGRDVILYDSYLDDFKEFELSEFPSKQELIEMRDYYNDMNVDFQDGINVKVTVPEVMFELFSEDELKYIMLNIAPQLVSQSHPQIHKSIMEDMIELFCKESGLTTKEITLHDFIEWYQLVANKFGSMTYINLSKEPRNNFSQTRETKKWKWTRYIEYQTIESDELRDKIKLPLHRKWKLEAVERKKVRAISDEKSEVMRDFVSEKREIERSWKEKVDEEVKYRIEAIMTMELKLNKSKEKESELKLRISKLNEEIKRERNMTLVGIAKRNVKRVIGRGEKQAKPYISFKENNDATINRFVYNPNISREQILLDMEYKKRKDNKVSNIFLGTCLFILVIIFSNIIAG